MDSYVDGYDLILKNGTHHTDDGETNVGNATATISVGQRHRGPPSDASSCIAETGCDFIDESLGNISFLDADDLLWHRKDHRDVAVQLAYVPCDNSNFTRLVWPMAPPWTTNALAWGSLLDTMRLLARVGGCVDARNAYG